MGVHGACTDRKAYGLGVEGGTEDGGIGEILDRPGVAGDPTLSADQMFVGRPAARTRASNDKP